MSTHKDKQQQDLDRKIEVLPYFAIKYFETYRGTLQENTVSSYISDIKEFLYWLCHEGLAPSKDIRDMDVTVLNDLHLEDVSDYKNYLLSQKNKDDQPLAVTTVNRKLSALKSLFNYLIKSTDRKTRKPYIERNVMAQLPLLKDGNTEDTRVESIQNNILIEEEISLFRKFVYDGFSESDEAKDNKRILSRWRQNRERDTAIISLLLGTGLRIAELEGITLKDLDIKARKIKVIRKGGEKRSVSYSKVAHKDLMNYLEIRSQRYGATKDETALFLVLYRDQAKPMTKRAMQKMIKKYAEAFGKPQVTAHKLRHSFATNHIKKVNSIPMLQKILNHKDPATTMIYSKVFESEIQESIDKADN
ncbi:tyrosine recombinase XerS [Cytobacillus firmus]|uniref:Tyrosine recombinase XerS n=1 Tax=Cytobacillus firmus TaxID=1399 RepID=A0AA46P5H6_CYTFI|nr:tyrosine recombinase XerS [Cytobacillus firmus]UYG98102.1 tyrosine recombinase XerS [Cytobacillus firmus]